MTLATIAALVVRYGLVMLFLPCSALDKLLGVNHAVEQAREVFRPRLLAVVVLLVGLFIEIVCTLGVVSGVADRACAFVIAGYCTITAVLYKRVWAQGDFWSAPTDRACRSSSTIRSPLPNLTASSHDDDFRQVFGACASRHLPAANVGFIPHPAPNRTISLRPDHEVEQPDGIGQFRSSPAH